MAASAASDRLSHLSDDVLIHILSFLPSNEAARTTVLSRRWRCPLWLDTGAVNLDSRSYATTGGSPVSDADHAVAFQHSHGRAPSMVTVVMHNGSMTDDVLRAACRDEAAVQDLRLDCKDGGWPHFHDDCKICSKSDPIYSLPPELLPFASLRLLDLNGCHLTEVKPPLTVSFPCLAALRLRLCALEIATLQDIVSSAPVLVDLRLESLRFTDRWPSNEHLRLRCPAATAVAITNLAARHMDWCRTLEIDAPLLRRFRYTQHVWFGDDEVSFESPPPTGLKRVDIEVRSPVAPLRSILGRGECHTRVLKLRVFSIADIVGRVGVLPEFPNLELLEIEELCGCLDDRVTAASATMDMLRCCRSIRELRFKFTFLDGTSVDPADHSAAMSEFIPCTLSFDDGHCCGVSYFPMSTPDYDYLRSTGLWRHSLRTVVVRSDMEVLTCFQLQLVSFLARNAESLEEVDVVGAGENRYMDRKVVEWRATRWTAGLPDRRGWIFRQPSPPLSSFPPLGVHSASQDMHPGYWEQTVATASFIGGRLR